VGILTRAASTTGTDTAIDDVLNAANDIRLGSSYASADLAILNSSDWLGIRRIKSSQGLYVLDRNDPGQLGGIDHLFQLRVASTTSIPQGTALIWTQTASTSSGDGHSKFRSTRTAATSSKRTSCL
jgi:HK97 family phage major capsid protein